jgi:hypothetical protein
MANFVSVQTATNLGTTTINIPTTDTYNFVGTLTAPNLVPTPTPGAGGGAGTGTGSGPEVPSQIVVTVKQNGTTLLTTAPGALGFSLNTMQCTAGDIFTFVTSSSSPQDQQPQAIKLTLAVSEGPI